MATRDFILSISREMGRDLSPQIRILEDAFIDTVEMLAAVTDE